MGSRSQRLTFVLALGTLNRESGIKNTKDDTASQLETLDKPLSAPRGQVTDVGLGLACASPMPINCKPENARNQNGPRRSRCVSQYPNEFTQVLRSFLIPTRDNSPAMMPSSQNGASGTAAGCAGTKQSKSGVEARLILPLKNSCPDQPAAVTQ